LNKEAALDLIRKNPEGISRAEIAQLLDVSRSTVSMIVDDFIAAGLVVERGMGASRGGRRPIVLQLNAEAGRVVGVDMGATHLLVVVTDLLGNILAETETPLDIAQGPEIYLHQTYKLVTDNLQAAHCSLADVRAIGVGVPGPVIVDKGIVSAPPIMPGWDDFAIRQHLHDQWRKPITLDNDADLGALGEWAYGSGQGESNLVYIKIGTGIGCGILLNGQIYHGVLGTAGEIGHVTISEDGPPCTCGNYGCLEAMAGGRAIAQRAQLAIKAGQRTQLIEMNHSHEITARDVAVAAQAGDAVSQQLFSDAGRHIGSAIASLINLLNPGVVLIGGGVTNAGDFLLSPIRQAVNERTMRPSLRSVRIERAGLGRRSTALGAVALALTTTFQSYVESHRKRASRRRPATVSR
jgi:glucokinase-like ROK family protein